MAASTGKAGIGVTLELSDGATPTPNWATVANVTDLSAGGRTLATIDSTHLASPDYYAEFIAGLKTATAWTGTIQWDPTDPTLSDTTGLGKHLEDRTAATLRINFSGIGISKALQATGIVTELGNMTISPTAIITQAFGFTPSGKPSLVDVS